MEFRLGHHLQQAREQRRIAAGFPPPPAVGLMPVPNPDEQGQPASLAQLEGRPQAQLGSPKRRFADRKIPMWRKPSDESVLPPRLPSGLPSRAATNAANAANADRANAADRTRAAGPTSAPDAEPVPSKAPTLDRCLNCQGTVRVDMFDLVAGCAYLTCVDCGFTYTAKSPRSV